MPLFMDFHKMDDVSIEAVKVAHLADLEVQEKYGVKYHQFWVNEEEGMVFCLTEGPDKESCKAVHRESHGISACAITEVEGGFYKILMGAAIRVDDEGMVHHENGTVDLGYRNILVAAVYSTIATGSANFSGFQTTHWARQLIRNKITAFTGREIKWEADDSLIGVFNDSTAAVNCALAIQQGLKESQNNQPAIIFRIGISASQPLTEKGDFFNGAIRQAHRICNMAKEGQVLLSSLANRLCKEEYSVAAGVASFKSLDVAEEEFITKLMNITELKLSDCCFSVDELCEEICISRPQLYRKITAISGRSPHDLIRDLRMNKALLLLKRKAGNIAEIAYKTGFNSPSYFTKCFAEKFGCTPSAFAKKIPA